MEICTTSVKTISNIIVHQFSCQRASREHIYNLKHKLAWNQSTI
uniref:Uncharacterized protein n=1 Tax=Arundo donax TaxID=35708 RepID=A0A0A9APU6_ARUDO